MIKEMRDPAAAHVVAAPIDAAQTCDPRSSCSEISFDIDVYMEGNTQGRTDPEPGQLESSSASIDQLESPSAGTGFETPGQQCLPNWEMGRTTVDGCLVIGVSSNLGGNNVSLEELGIRVQTDSQTPTTFASSKIVYKKMSRKPKDKESAKKENKQF